MLRNLLKNISHFSLSAMILIAGSGFTLNRMDCLMSGKSFYSIESFECCDDAESESAIESQCCEFSVLALNLDIISDSKTVITKISVPDLPELVSEVFQSFALTTEVPTDAYPMPPPKGTLAFLTFFQVFRL